MARYHPIKNSFVSGEVSPRLEGRDDIDQYFQSMRQAVNGIVLPHGGFMRRSGSIFVSEVKDSTKQVRLIPFIFSRTEAYIVELGHLYARFYVNNGQLVSGVPVEIVTPYTEDELFDIQYVQDANVMFMVHPNHATRRLTRTSATAFSLASETYLDGRAPMNAINLSNTTITIAGSSPNYTATASAAIFDTTDDVGRAMYLAGDDAWFILTAVSSTTVATAQIQTGSTVVTGAKTDWSLGMFSNVMGANAVTFHQGRLVYGGSRDEPDRFVMSVSDSFSDFQLADAAATDAENADKAISRRVVSTQVNAIAWLRSAASRMVIGTAGGEFTVTGSDGDTLTPTNTAVKPATTAGSAPILPVVVGETVLYAQRNRRKIREFVFDLRSDGFLASNVTLLSEHILDGGIIDMSYMQDPDDVVWITRGDGVLVGITFVKSQSVVAAHRHIFGAPDNAVVESAAVIPEPNQTQDQMWLSVKRTINGTTKRYIEYMANQFRPQVSPASTQAELIAALDDAFFVDSGLSLNVPLTITDITQASPGVVTSTAHGLSNGDFVKIRDVKGMTEVNLVSYKVANVTADTFELTDQDDDTDVDTTGFTAYDSGGTAREETMTISGLDHLEGETVQILADGAVHPDRVVASGSVSLDRRASIVRAGLGYDYICETQRFIGGGTLGTDQGWPARIKRAIFRVHNSLGGRVAVGAMPDDDALEVLPSRDGDDPSDQSPPMRTGDIDVPVEGSWDDPTTIYIKQDQPLPFTILSIMPDVESGER